jgi:hypothetical protein
MILDKFSRTAVISLLPVGQNPAKLRLCQPALMNGESVFSGVLVAV